MIVGLCLTGTNKLIEGIILGLSAGTFIYVAASEVIVEEFAVTKYKYSKYFVYFIGAVFIYGLAAWEAFSDDEH